MAKHVELAAEPRELIGKKVRRLRTQGVLPATVYGHDVTPQSIQINAHDFGKVLKAVGRTQLIDLMVGGERARPVFVKQMAIDAKRNAIQHVEFYQANLREKMQTSVPLHFAGESQAVKDGGILLTLLDHVTVESLPDDVPAGIDVDISVLTDFTGAVHVSELQVPSAVAVVTPGDDLVCKVNPPVAEEAIEEVLEETALPTELGGDEPQADAVPES